MNIPDDKVILVTGSAGFIGFHVAHQLLQAGKTVVGVDAMIDYYSPQLKRDRTSILNEFEKFRYYEFYLEDKDKLAQLFEAHTPTYIIHLAAQAGVRHSLTNPQEYLDHNIQGTFTLMEQARSHGVEHFLFASTSSVYGDEKDMPFLETMACNTQLTIYAATKKACESMLHSYAHLWGTPTTVFRFFTVYGPWGRPDLALFKFIEAGKEDRPIDVYNQGEMQRDFTYVGDLAKSVNLLTGCVPPDPRGQGDDFVNGSHLSSNIAPYRIVNIGRNKPENLNHFISVIEKVCKIKFKRNDMPMQKGDVPATWASADRLLGLTGYLPDTEIEQGIRSFYDWYEDYYGK